MDTKKFAMLRNDKKAISKVESIFRGGIQLLIANYYDKKNIKFTETVPNYFGEELNKIAIVYAAYLAKVNSIDGDYDEFIAEIKVQPKIKVILENTIKDIWEFVKFVKNEFSEDELLAYSLFADFSNYKYGENTTPESIVGLCDKLLNIKKGDSVLDLCSGEGIFIRDSFIKQPAAHYSGIELDYVSKGISDIRTEILGCHSKIYLKDVFEYKDEEKYDKVFSNYPVSLKMRKNKDVQQVIERCSDFIGIDKSILEGVTTDWLFNILVIEKMKETGKGIAVSTGKNIWSQTVKDVQTRKNLLEKGFVESVIALPANLHSMTAIPFYLIVFSKGNKKVSMIDASGFGSKGKSRKTVFTESDINKIISAVGVETEYSKVVSCEEISNKGYTFDPVKYVENLPDFKDGIKLEDIAVNILRGDQFSGKDLKKIKINSKTQYRCLDLSDMKEGYIEFKEEYLKELPEGREKYLAKNKMIIITRNANPEFRSAIIEPRNDEKILVTGHFIMIEIDESKANPKYVQSFLASETGKKCLNNISTGSVIKNLSLGQLKKMIIPVPDRKIQDKIGAEYMATLDEMLMLKLKLTRKEDALKHIYEEGYFA